MTNIVDDHIVWLQFAVARSQQSAGSAAGSLPEVVSYADKALAAFKQRFPQPADVTAPALSLQDPSDLSLTV